MKYIKNAAWLICLFAIDLHTHNYAVVGNRSTKHVTSSQKKHLFQSVSCELMHDMLIQDSNIMQNVYTTTYYKENKNDLNAWSKQYACCVRAKKLVPMYLKYVSPIVGYGVFASTHLKKNDFLGVYSGEFRCMRDGVADKAEDVDYAWFYSTSAANGKKIIVDAKYKGNELRFINHSSTPNTQRIDVLVDGILYICYIAICDICKDEQLTVNYGKEYWTSRGVKPESVA